MHYSVQPRDRIFVKGYEFLSSAKNTAKIFLIMLKNLQQRYLKLVQKKSFKKQLKQLVIDNKIADRITKVTKTLPQNNSETITNEHDKEKSKERHVSPEERQEIIYELRLK